MLVSVDTCSLCAKYHDWQQGCSDCPLHQIEEYCGDPNSDFDNWYQQLTQALYNTRHFIQTLREAKLVVAEDENREEG